MAMNTVLHARSTITTKTDGSFAIEELSSTNKAVHSVMKGGTWDYGPWPQNAYLDINGAVTAQTAADVFVSNDISIYDSVAFDVFVLTGTTPALKAFPSFDGVTFSTVGLAITDLSSATLTTAIAGGTGVTAVGNYMIALPAKVRKIKLAYSASVAGNASLRGGIWKR